MNDHYKHPELRPGEFLVSNVREGEEWIYGFRHGLKSTDTGRVGNVAYDRWGKEYPGYVPIFSLRWWPGLVNGKLIRILASNEIHPHDIEMLTAEEKRDVKIQLGYRPKQLRLL